MKTSWNELQIIEDYLLSNPESEDQILFEVRLILQSHLQESVVWQQKTYDLVHRYGRLQLKKEIEQVHEKLFGTSTHATFKAKIMRFFEK